MEYDLASRQHPHPLLFEEEVNIGDAVVMCSRCRLPLNPPAYSCSDSDCNFHIHQSCLHLPSQIHNPALHPQHYLRKTETYDSSKLCRFCGQSMPAYDVIYTCGQGCSFDIDIRCAMENRESTKFSGFWLSGKYAHFKHPHPLSLQQQPHTIKKTAVCVICEHLIIQSSSSSSSSSYFCCSQSECEDIHFHKQCAELPRVLENLDYHPHPLVLVFLPTNHKESSSMCNSCRNMCVGWVFTCLLCKFFLHLACLQSFNHIHTYTNILSNKIAFTCTLCGEKCEAEFPWYCDNCHNLVHRKCAEFSSSVMTNEHNHVLTLNYYFDRPANNNTYTDRYTGKIMILCQICGKGMNSEYGGYGCSTCNNNFIAHLKCAAETQRDDYHLINGDDTINCDLVLPEEYANLPRRIKPLSRLHPHPLTLISIHPHIICQCHACSQHFNGFAYYCQTCFATLDVRCATLTNPFKHPNHQHPLYLCQSIYEQYYYCDACGKMRNPRKLVFGCSLCNFFLDISCVTLPVEVRYRFDAHPLKLSYIEEEEERVMSEYYCDICEEEREVGVWFYSCLECKFEAHPRCALGEFPYVNSAMHKSHKHPLTLETLKKLEKEESREDSNLAFQCGVCNFTLHAEEQYNLAFMNQNLFSRAIQLYHHYPIQKRHIGESLIILGPFGDQSAPNIWKEWVFSTITAFAFFIGGLGGINGHQIQYAKNGRLVWSEPRGSQLYDKTVVSFDYPDEYLVSIHGSHGVEKSDTMEITSLTLETNKKAYGPFGHEGRIKFSSVKEGVKIIGIFGSDFLYRIQSIGFYGISTTEE